MRSLFVFSIIFAGLLICFMVATVSAQDARTGSNDNRRVGLTYGSLDDPEDPQNILPAIRERGTRRDSLFPVSPLRGLHDFTDQEKQDLYEITSLKLGLNYTHLFQKLSDSLRGEDNWGVASDLDFVGTWELIERGKPTQGQLFFHWEGRWDHGTTDPQNLGTVSLGSLVQTANTFAEYKSPEFLVRNLYWQQGSKEAGWAYRIGKITPDAILSTSVHISAITTFLTTAGTGPFANGLADSGLGAVGAWYINDRVTLLGLVSDANADRSDFGDIGEGDFYKAVELAAKIAPKTPKAGYSKLTFWHSDGTEGGEAINGSTGHEGWGFFLKHEQELTDDGRAVGVLRFGKSFNDSALYKQQGGASFLLYDPPGPNQIQNDLLGVAFNWAKSPQSGARDEYNVEVFYRFPLFPLVDMTLSYQSVIRPALDPNNDHASAFSIRIRTTF